MNDTPRRSRRRLSGTGARFIGVLLATGAVLPATCPVALAETLGRMRVAPVPVEPGEGVLIGPIVFSPSAQFSTTWDSNVFKVDTGYDPDGAGPASPSIPEGDLLSIGLARLALKLPISHSFLSLVWMPSYRTYASTPTLLKTSNVVNFDSLFNTSGGAKLAVRDYYTSSFYESRRYTSPDYALVMTSIPYWRNLAMLDWERYLTTTTGVGGTLSREDFNADQTEAPGLKFAVGGIGDENGSYFDYFDYTTGLIEVRGFHDRSSQRLYATARYANTDQDRREVKQSQLRANGCLGPGPPPVGSQKTICDQIQSQVDFETIRQLEGLLGVQGTVFSYLQADLKVGYVNWQFLEGNIDPYSGIALKGFLMRRFTNRTTATLDLEDVPAQTAGQYRGYYLRRAVGVAISRVLTRGLEARVVAFYTKLSFPGSNEPIPPNASESFRESVSPFTITDIEPTVELSYLTRRAGNRGPFLLKAVYNPMSSASDLPGLDIRSQRLTFSIQYGWF